MTEDLVSRLRKIREAKAARDEVRNDKYKDSYEKWLALTKSIIKPALRVVEQEFELCEGRPVTATAKSDDDIFLQVGEDEDRCWRLHFKIDESDDCVIVVSVSPAGHERNKSFQLEALTKTVVDDEIAEFMKRAL